MMYLGQSKVGYKGNKEYTMLYEKLSYENSSPFPLVKHACDPELKNSRRYFLWHENKWENGSQWRVYLGNFKIIAEAMKCLSLSN